MHGHSFQRRLSVVGSIRLTDTANAILLFSIDAIIYYALRIVFFEAMWLQSATNSII